MRIAVLKNDYLKDLLRKEKPFTTYTSVLNSLITENGKQNEKKKYEDCIASLQSKIPFSFKKTSLKNGLGIYKAFDLGLLTGIIYTFLNDNSYGLSNNNSLGYQIEDFQKLFIHLKTKKLKEIDSEQNLLSGYNELLKKFSEKEHPFGNISIDDNWDIIRGHSKSIDTYKILILGRKKKSPPKWLKPVIITTFFLLFGIFGYTSFSNFFNKKENNILPTQEQCSLEPEYTNNVRIVILEFKQDSTSNNKNFANRLYQRIKKVIDRDSLSLEVSICKQFNNYQTPNDAIHDKELSSFMKNLHRRDQKLYVYSFSMGSKASPSDAIDFLEFKTRTTKFAESITVRDVFDEREFNFISYYQIVRAIARGGNKHSKIMGIKYINDILLSDSLDISDVKLLNYRASFKLTTSGKNKQLEDLEKILSIDSLNTSALFNLGNRAFYDDNSDCIKYYKRYLEIIPHHCNVRFQLAKSLAYFNNDFQSAHKLVDITLKEGVNLYDCRNNKDYKLNKGELLMYEKRYDEAIEYLLEVHLLNKNSIATNKLSHVYYLNGEYQQSINLLKPIVDIPNHSDTNAEEYLALTYRKMGQPKLAIKSILSSGEGARSCVIASHLYLEIDNLELALKYINKAIEKSNDDVAFFYNQRRIINSRLGLYRYSKIDSLKIIDKIDSDYFKLKKYDGFHPYFGFNKLYGKINLDNDRPRSIIK